ncbi:MAG TPA: hypothetical protein VH643_21270 [Gemmataceae bacterium]
MSYCLWERGPHYGARAAEAGLLGQGATVGFAVATARCLSGSPRLALAVAAGAATEVAAVSCLAAGWVLDGMARSTRSLRCAEAALG